MKDTLAFQNTTRDDFCDGSKRLGHTRQHFNLMTALAEWAISDAGGRDAVFGTKPGVADYTPTDLGTEAGRAVKSNIANYDDITKLLERILPGYKDMVAQGSKNTQSLLRGEIPEDVQQAVKRSAAYRSISGGFAGSGMSKALTDRDFGRTSLDLMEQGQNASQRWMAATQGSASPYIVTAPAQAAQTERNNLYEQAVSQFRFNTAAAPDPGAAGQFNLQTALGSQAMSFGMGSAMQGMGGGSKAAPATATANTAYPYNWWGTG